ncbi:hypothetical protein SeMB42_g05796 [Synchytrium endobioticum]|uniref:cAMP-dependent protein kinase n=1 Tax=Synchytrium endobioticum TaxID=286115 RepID=A0A507DH62_9FUNG|nr:hypothetical protein SeMB42_g05796 [Synchytrium endobioticum]TPX50924.1 hypothetical protein SeLEV6574_g00611 [Synchytrium endobioticum]
MFDNGSLLPKVNSPSKPTTANSTNDLVKNALSRSFGRGLSSSTASTRHDIDATATSLTNDSSSSSRPKGSSYSNYHHSASPPTIDCQDINIVKHRSLGRKASLSSPGHGTLLKNAPLSASLPSGLTTGKVSPQSQATMNDVDESDEMVDLVSELSIARHRPSQSLVSDASSTTPPDAASIVKTHNKYAHKSLPKIVSMFNSSRHKPQTTVPPPAKSSKVGSFGSAMLLNTNFSSQFGTGSISAGLNNPSNAALGLQFHSPSEKLGMSGKNQHVSAYEIGPAPSALRSYFLEDFHLVRRVGKGGFATVYLVRLKASTGRYYALKAIKKADVVRLKQERQILNEKNILREVKHALIVELFVAFQDVSYLYMVMEYVAGGDLFSYLRRVQRFSEDDTKFYTAEVVCALDYLHQQMVVYRDLKPENILLDSTGHIKLADFGFAKVVRETTSSFCGTPDYIAAEVVNSRPYTHAVDWWSLGVLIFELCSGKTPFGDDTSERIYDNIQAGRIKWHPLIKGHCKDIVRRLLELDVERRIGSGATGASDIKSHPWFKPLSWRKVESRQITPPYIPSCERPEVLEELHSKSGGEDHAEALRQAGKAWLHGGDPFFEMFKDF